MYNLTKYLTFMYIFLYIMLQEKVTESPNACKIGLFFSADAVIPQNFFDTIINIDQEEGIYLTSGSLKFKETSKESSGGISFTQTIEFSLPTTDELRSERLHKFIQVRFIAVKLTNGKVLFFGRNDIKQNTRPKIKISSNEKLTSIQYKQISMFALGFTDLHHFIFQDGTPFIFQDGLHFN